MIIYNITSKVHTTIDADWLHWQRNEYIPAIMATGFFSSYKILRLLEQDDSEGNTYAVQFMLPDAESYQAYLHTHASALRKKALDQWNERTISFHSLLEVIHQ